MSPTAAGMVLAAFLTGLLAPRFLGGSGSHADRMRVEQLQQANSLLQAKLRVAFDTLQEVQKKHGATIEDLAQKMSGFPSEDGLGGGGGGQLRKCRKQLVACRQKGEVPDTALKKLGLTAAAVKPGERHAENDTLLAAHARWDWKTIVQDIMQPWPRIEPEQLVTAVAACNDNGTMYCSRMQIIDGSLHLTDYRAIFFDRHYAPARVMPLLETLRRHPHLPNMDLVVAGNDEPRVPSIPGERGSWSRMCSRYTGRMGGKLPPAIFASTTNRGTLDLPWVDFAWFFPRRPHKLRTPPWSVLQPQLYAAGGRVSWEDKAEIAMHTGNVGSPFRKLVAAAAAKHPQEMLVNELFIGDHQKIKKTCRELGLDRTGGYQQHKCFMRFEDQCRYKYLLNSASIGYANKLKSLLLCGSVVIYVRDGMRHKEFYEYGLVSGIHYVAVDTAEDVPAMVRWLREHDDYASAVAQAGRARMSSLDVVALTDFMAELLTQYAKRQAFAPQALPGAVRIECEDDLWRHYALSRSWMQNYLMEDNATCVHPPKPGVRLSKPGWGGAYAGSKPRCYASHDLGWKAQPEACSFDKPFSTAESWEPQGKFPFPHPRDSKLGEKWVDG